MVLGSGGGGNFGVVGGLQLGDSVGICSRVVWRRVREDGGREG